jgi:phosphate acetyltransferase
MWAAALVSAVLGTELPGPGTLYLRQEVRFDNPVSAGDVITARVTVLDKQPGREHDQRLVRLTTLCTNQRGEEVLTGIATVIAPRDPIEWPRMPLPEVTLRRHDRYEGILRDARGLGAMPVAIVHPCSIDALRAAMEARDEGLHDPVLVGPEARIRALAEQAGLSLAGISIEATEHSHAAAARAVELAVQGRVTALMKGSLHTDELLGAIVRADSGLHTERRISHVYAMDVPLYYKPLIVTDAAINIAPTLAHKRDICQNAIDLLHVMGVPVPHVAVLAAVETVNADMPATLDAAALTVMAARGQITGAKVDGPLAFDNAISLAAARIKEIVSPVAGSADILLVPNLEAGNMLAKQLIYLSGADAAGLVLGARVPIVLTSRADSLRVRLASAALARLVAQRRLAAKGDT